MDNLFLDLDKQLIFKEDESSGIKWIPFEEADDKSMCDFIRPIHKKLVKMDDTCDDWSESSN